MVRLGLVAVEENKLAELCRPYQVRELAVFGSAPRGDMRQDSDVDLLLSFYRELKSACWNMLDRCWISRNCWVAEWISFPSVV